MEDGSNTAAPAAGERSVSGGDGFFLMRRGWMENPVLCRDRKPFSRHLAWIWMIENAQWREGQTMAHPRGRIILQRGELGHSTRFMGRAWQWNQVKVRRFLAALEEDGMIETRTSQPVSDPSQGWSQTV